MKAKELIEKASIKVGGQNELARVLRWDKGTASKIKNSGKLSPYRAAQVAEILGADVVAAYLDALADQSSTPHERAFWEEQLKERKKKLKFP